MQIRLTGVALGMAVSMMLSSQCIPEEPPFSGPSSQQLTVALAALGMLECCALCTNNEDIQDVAEALGEKLEDGHVYVQEGDGSWRAYAWADVRCGNFGAYTLDPGNSIVVNSGLFFDYADSVATAAILAGALAHEQLHATTLETNADFSTDPTTYSDPCAVYTNEIFCHEAELFLLNCFISCGCLSGITGAGETNITNRITTVSSWRDHFLHLHTEKGC